MRWKLWTAVLLSIALAGCGSEGGTSAPNLCEGVDCGEHGACVTTGAGEAACLCGVGYASDGPACVPAQAAPSPCAAVDCGHGACVVTVGGDPACLCEAGYGAAGLTCEATPTPGHPCDGADCGEHGVCVAAAGGAPACLCDAGYIPEGSACVEQVAATHGCEGVDCGHGTCVLGGAGPVCLCDPGYRSAGAACEPVASPCDGVDCSGKGACVVASSGAAICVCEAGFVADGPACVPVATGTDPCEGVSCSGKGACVPTSTGPACLCEPGTFWKGSACLPNVDPCADVDCGGGACYVTAGGPGCLCQPGHVAAGASCVPAAEPCSTVSCSGHGTCVELGGSPACVCAPGHHPQGLDCVADTDPCAGVACSGHGDCVVASSGAVCLCHVGYYGVGTACVEAPLGAIPTYAPSDPSNTEADPDTGLLYVARELLVMAAEGHDASALAVTVVGLPGSIASYDPGTRFYKIVVDAGPGASGVSAAVATLRLSPQVAAVLPNGVLSGGALPGDPWGTTPGDEPWTEASPAGDNWYLEAIRAPAAWALSTGAGAAPVDVGVVDGPFGWHDDLLGVLSPQDWALLPVPLTAPEGKGWHGTQVAGVMAAEADNDIGVAGVVWRSRVRYGQAGSLDDVCPRLLDQVRKGAKVVNISLGQPLKDEKTGAWLTLDGKDPADSTLPSILAWPAEQTTLWETCLGKLLKEGHTDWLVLQSAGNDAIKDARWQAFLGWVQDPNLRSHILIVGAADSELKELTCYSNKSHLDIVAPGGDSDCFWFPRQIRTIDGTSGFRDVSGTSFSAPMVAGAAALLKYANPALTGPEIGDLLVDSASKKVAGFPLLDVGAAMDEVASGCAGAWNAATGQCCAPSCGGKQCGADECGGTCGTLGDGESECVGNVVRQCIGGAHVESECATLDAVCVEGPEAATCDAGDQECVPWCGGKQCGPDGCGGTCDICATGFACTPSGQCVALSDAPPSGSIVSPPAGATVTGPFTIAVEAQDDAALVKLTVIVSLVGGGQVYKESAYPGGKTATFTTKAVSTQGWPDGEYFIALWGLDEENPALVLATATVTLAQGPCVPACGGVECGDDGCGGTCAPGCGWGEGCDPGTGLCVPIEDTEGMVQVPAGTFWMGCSAAVDTECNSDEKPYHEVYVSGFEIDATETTVAAYAECVAAGGCGVPESDSWCSPSESGAYGATGKEQHSLNCVTWYDAEDYCDWAGKRLCTEAEWEKAARGTDGRKYPWGNAAASCAYAVMNDGDSGCGTDSTWAVGSKPAGASPYGALDMAGNVREWAADWYGAVYYSASPAANPAGPPSGAYRVYRGGDFGGYGYGLRASYRDGYHPSHSDPGLGLRCCKSVE